MRKRKIYNIINAVIILSCIATFVFQYIGVLKDFFQNSILTITIVLITMATVLAIKYLRIYFIFYGLNIKNSQYVKLFSKTTFVNLLIPFKLGDFFRAYCYGYAIENYVQGFCYIILDRFMDTLALVTVLGCLSIIGVSKIPLLLFAMIAFLAALIVLYITFPALYKYWNMYFLKFNATKRKLWVLSVINKLNKVYGILKEHIRGKGIILYVLSLTAWLIEGMGFWLIVHNGNLVSGSFSLFEYLSAALGMGVSKEQELSLIACIIISVFAYICAVFCTKNRRIKK